MKHSTTDI